MDLLDKKILCELDIDCRQPFAAIAKKVGSSRAVVGYRIKNLEKDGVIESYITAINLGKLGYTSYKIYFKLFNLNDRAEKEFYSFMKEAKCVIHCLKTEGAFDCSIVVAVSSIKELDDFLTELKNQFSAIIRDYQISLVVMSRIFKLSKILIGKESKEPKAERFSGSKEDMALDEKDKAILQAIANNANMPIVEIANKTNLSIDIVKYRMRKMQETGIVNTFRAIYDTSKLGFHHYVILLKTRKITKTGEEMINSWAKMHHSVMYITKRIGNWDYELNVALASIDDFSEFIGEMKKQLSEMLESYDTIINTKIIKLNYFPL